MNTRWKKELLGIALGLMSASVSQASPLASTAALSASLHAESERHAELRVGETVAIYQKRLQEFHLAMNNPQLTDAQKAALFRMNLRYAQKEIESQTDGKGLIYQTLMVIPHQLAAEVEAGRAQEAAQKVDQYFSWVLNLI